MTDAELVRATLAGSRDAFAEIARRWAARVTAVCHARSAGPTSPTTWPRRRSSAATGPLRTLSDPAKVGTWLMGIGPAGVARLAEGPRAVDAAVQRARPGPADRVRSSAATRATRRPTPTSSGG